ncbi:aldehyde dehydrogenase family protein, partial [Comamonadaceae bacterium OH3737_COT-264]
MPSTLAQQTAAILQKLGVDSADYVGGSLAVHSPVDGSAIGALRTHSAEQTRQAIAQAQQAFAAWRQVPAPQRGELVRLLGEELRAEKDTLGQLVSIEAGKILTEGLGEVQEMIDICDFAVGLSRQLYGLTIASERPGHRMMETWHPLGVVGVITAFNFPVAVWAWPPTRSRPNWRKPSAQARAKASSSPACCKAARPRARASALATSSSKSA